MARAGIWIAVRDFAFAAGLALAGGYVFFRLGTPLPWMLGALTFTAINAVWGGHRFIPPIFRTVSRPIVGVLAGSAFDSATVASLMSWWDAVLLVIAQSLVVTMLGMAFFRVVGGFDRQTAFFSAVPAGLAEMSLLGSALGGSARSIVMVHLIRILIVLFSVPFIAQAIHGGPIVRTLPATADPAMQGLMDWLLLAVCGVAGFGLARLVPFAAGTMVFPMALSAIVHGLDLTRAAPPPILVAAVQVVVGGVVGARFAGLAWHELRRTVVAAALWAVIVMAIAGLSAYAASRLLGEPFLWLMLALAPAGTMEMTILAFSLGLNVPFVVVCQLSRILFLQLVGPLLFDALRFVARRRDRDRTFEDD